MPLRNSIKDAKGDNPAFSQGLATSADSAFKKPSRNITGSVLCHPNNGAKPRASTELRKRPSVALISIFLAYALVMGIVESRIPFDFFVPGVKLGLANVVVLASLYLFPARDALKIVLLKCALTAVAAGTGLSLLFSLGGSLLSFCAMALLVRFCGDALSPVGVSVVGAVAHNFGQIAVASVVMGSIAVVAYLPVLIVSGVVTGILVGLAAKGLVGLTRSRLKMMLKGKPS